MACSNWALELFHDSLKAVIYEQGLENNKKLINFLEKIDQGTYGRGCIYIELNDYFNDDLDKLPVQLLYDLTTKTIEKIEQQYFGEYRENYLALLNGFKDKIL